MNEIQTAEKAAQLLDALGEQLERVGVAYELVVVGGSALLALGLVTRPTKDVDVVALRSGLVLQSANPLPGPLLAARDRVARDFQLPADWLNDGPASLLTLGLPDGFLWRARRDDHGPALTVWYASRLDQVHFKLYAAVDQGPGKHEADLRALNATQDELLTAARWTLTHDPSSGYRHVLEQALTALGVRNASLGA
jgi:hypothetical protein